MTFDLAKIIESKRAFRRKLAAMPIEQKLRLLDAMQDRDKAIQKGKRSSHEQSEPKD